MCVSVRVCVGVSDSFVTVFLNPSGGAGVEGGEGKWRLGRVAAAAAATGHFYSAPGLNVKLIFNV